MPDIPCQLQHPQRSTDVTIHRVIDSSIEIYTRRTVYDYVDRIEHLLLVLGGETHPVFKQVALSIWLKKYIG